MDHFIQLSNFSKIVPYAQMFEQGLVVTVLLSLFTVLIGFVLALLLALMRMSNVRPFRSLGLDQYGHLRDGGFLLTLSKFNPLSFLATAYVEVLRSTPVIVQVMIIYYGVFGIIDLPRFTVFGFIKFERFFPGVVALGMNSVADREAGWQGYHPVYGQMQDDSPAWQSTWGAGSVGACSSRM